MVPNTQPEHPLAQLKATTSCTVFFCCCCYQGEEADPNLATASFQMVVESDVISPEPLLRSFFFGGGTMDHHTTESRYVTKPLGKRDEGVYPPFLFP